MCNVKLLTICIPTFNRKTQLLRQLHSLYNQIECSLVEIIICDNHSDYDVKKAIVGEFGEKNIYNIHVFVNHTNVGMHANLALMFRHCQTEWMWSLSDDDEALPNSIQTILYDIKQFPDTIMFKYGISGYNKYIEQDFASINSIIDFYYKRYPSGHLVFLSNNVYKMSVLRDYYTNTLSYCYCAVPQLLPVFFALENHAGIVRFKAKPVVEYKKPTPGTEWNYINTALSFSIISLIPFSLTSSYYHKLSGLMMSGFSHKKIIYLCLHLADKGRGRFIYNHLYRVGFKYTGAFKDKILMIMYKCMYILNIKPPKKWL